jgi:hypothetical protein
MGLFNYGFGDQVLPSRLQNVKVILSHVLLCTQNYRISLALEFGDLTPLSNSPFRFNVVVTSKYIGKDSLTLNSKFSFEARIIICLHLKVSGHCTKLLIDLIVIVRFRVLSIF